MSVQVRVCDLLDKNVMFSRLFCYNLSGSFGRRNTERYVVVFSCSVSTWWLRQLQRCGTAYQMWGAAFPQMLTCTTSPHSVLLISSLVILPVCVWLSFSLAFAPCRSPSPSLSLSQEAQTGPAEEEYMPQSSGHQPGPAEPQLCSQCQRCQPGWAHTALPKLLWSVCVPARVLKVCHVSLLFITTRLYKWGMRENEGGSRVRETDREGGSEGDKGQSHTIKLCSVGLQRPTSYSHAV